MGIFDSGNSGESYGKPVRKKTRWFELGEIGQLYQRTLQEAALKQMERMTYDQYQDFIRPGKYQDLMKLRTFLGIFRVGYDHRLMRCLDIELQRRLLFGRGNIETI